MMNFKVLSPFLLLIGLSGYADVADLNDEDRRYEFHGTTRNGEVKCTGILELSSPRGFFIQVNSGPGLGAGAMNPDETLRARQMRDPLTRVPVQMYEYEYEDVGEMNVRKRVRFYVDPTARAVLETEYRSSRPFVNIPNRRVRCRTNW